MPHNVTIKTKIKMIMYWSKRIILQTPIFSKIMPCRRFLSITHLLHFVDNETIPKEDRIRKVESVDYLNTRFQQVYIPEETNEIQRATELCAIYTVKTSNMWNKILQIV